MGNNTRYKLGDLESINEALNDMPAADPREKKVSKTEAITVLMPGIKALDQKGYSLAAVVQILKEHGVETSEASLAKMLKSGNRKGQSSRSTRTPVSPDSPRAGKPSGAGGVKPNHEATAKAKTGARLSQPRVNEASKNSPAASQETSTETGDTQQRPGSFSPRPDSSEI